MKVVFRVKLVMTVSIFLYSLWLKLQSVIIFFSLTDELCPHFLLLGVIDRARPMADAQPVIRAANTSRTLANYVTH